MKKKAVIIVSIIVFILTLSGITYSMFTSEANMESVNSNIAKFVFNDQSLDEINIDLDNLYPGTTLEYPFYISNNEDQTISDTKIMYQITIKTYHFIPLNIELYSVENEEETLVGVCDETYTRNSSNELVCNMPEAELNKTSLQRDDYILKISFPSNYNSVDYSNLVDFIKISISSYQKI